ncbi:hypothetical protein XsacCFBP4641_14325 [Xanthomonas sacchari]|uniref:Uncharacterized protein n=1 Tax=Xanthomonas sacchari TaxID=56458 RepID=A0A2P5Z1Q7_9XANT|nr:hypothetical protein XsacCFBP4641_14325 [Xanthomonas sacchari]
MREDAAFPASYTRTLQVASRRIVTPTPAPRPGPRLQRGRSRVRAPMARRPHPVGQTGEGLGAQ